jgi:hypothetical protein
MRLIAPLPAASRPSKITSTRIPDSTTDRGIVTISACKRFSSRSYNFFDAPRV